MSLAMILDSNQLKLAASLIHTIATHKLTKKQSNLLWHWLQPGYFFVPWKERPKLVHLSEHYYLPNPPATHAQFIKHHSSWEALGDLCTEQVQEYLWTNEFKISPTQVSSHSTPVLASSNSIDSTQRLNKLKISLEALRLRMATR